MLTPENISFASNYNFLQELALQFTKYTCVRFLLTSNMKSMGFSNVR